MIQSYLYPLKPNDPQRKLVKFLVSILKTSHVSSYATHVSCIQKVSQILTLKYMACTMYTLNGHTNRRALACGLNITKQEASSVAQHVLNMTGSGCQRPKLLAESESSMGRRCCLMGRAFVVHLPNTSCVPHQHREVPEDSHGPCFYEAKPSLGRDNLGRKQCQMSSSHAWDAPTWLMLYDGNLFTIHLLLHVFLLCHPTDFL